jgi:hypothetical protein
LKEWFLYLFYFALQFETEVGLRRNIPAKLEADLSFEALAKKEELQAKQNGSPMGI